MGADWMRPQLSEQDAGRWSVAAAEGLPSSSDGQQQTCVRLITKYYTALEPWMEK